MKFDMYVKNTRNMKLNGQIFKIHQYIYIYIYMKSLKNTLFFAICLNWVELKGENGFK